MRRLRLPLGFAVSLLLIALVAVFATLQYRWLGQASEADREQMRRSSAERARQFASDFDGEISAIYFYLQDTEEGDATQDAERLANRVAEWRKNARFPEVVREIYTVHIQNGTSTLSRFIASTGTLEQVDWPARFERLRPRVSGQSAAFYSIPTTNIAPLDSRAPAMLIPPTGPSNTFTIAELDPAVLRDTVIATLMRQYFSGEGGEPYRVAIADANGQAVFTSDAGAAIIGTTPDASAALFQLRPDSFAEKRAIELRSFNLTERRAPLFSAGGTLITGSGSRMVLNLRSPERDGTRSGTPNTWTLLLQHPSGSIDAAVAAGRRRNLWVSFGILSLMVAGMLLVSVNARRSQRLAAQQMEFVATVSHELRTPVAAMRAAAQNLSAGVVPDPQRIKLYGDLIETEGRRLTEMVEQVLEYSGVSGDRPLNLGPVDLREVVERAAESCQPLAASAGCSVDVAMSNDVPTVNADATALHRAVSNLIANAVKHGADGKWVGVSVGSTAGNGGRPEVEISVRDHGQGIDADDLPRIFEPFHRGRRALDRQIQGSGLGLSLVQRITEAHGGRVTVQSAHGEGATFTIYLPA